MDEAGGEGRGKAGWYGRTSESSTVISMESQVG